MILRSLIIALMLTGGLAQAQQGGVTPKSAVLFTVKDSPVFVEEFNYLYKKNHPKQEDFTEEKINEYLVLFINFKLKIAEAKKRGLDTTRAFVKEFNGYKEELAKPYHAGADDLDRLAKEVYERLKLEVKAVHILTMVKPDATPSDTVAAYRKISDLRLRALKGEDFEKLAKEFSDDPSAKSNGGDLGYFSALQMVYPFEEAAYKTDVGSISPVIRTRFGYHILKVVDRRPAQGEVEVSHILLRSAQGNEAKIKNTIFEIYDQVKGGRKWDELCKEFSDDTNTRNSGGKLKPFGVGAFRSSLPEFEQVAFSLKSPGEISDPFHSNIGWHLIRLEKKIPIQTYKDMESSLKRKIAHDDRLAVSRNLSFEKRKKEMGFAEVSEVKSRIFSMADSSLIQGKWHPASQDTSAGKTLVTFQEVKTPARDFYAYITTHQAKSSLSPAAYMKQLYDRFVEEQVSQQEEKKLMCDHPEYVMLLNEYKEGILLFEIMEKEVWNKASGDSAGQHQYYREHPDRFKAGNRVEARIFATPDKSFLSEIKSRIAAADTLKEADIKKFKSVTNWKAYERTESQVIDKINWVPGLQETELNGTYYLVEISRLVPPGGKSFEEARATVISEYQDFLEKEWLKQLRQKYRIRINKKGKLAVIAGLRK